MDCGNQVGIFKMLIGSAKSLFLQIKCELKLASKAIELLMVSMPIVCMVETAGQQRVDTVVDPLFDHIPTGAHLSL
jgi:hypothetical protein